MMMGRSLFPCVAMMSSGGVSGDRARLRLQLRFEIAERRTHLAHQDLACELDRDGRYVTAHARHEGHFDDLEGPAFLVGGMAHGNRDRTDEAVAHQYAEKGADERGADLVTYHGRVCAIKRRHRVYDAEHGRDDTEAGQRIGYRLNCMRRLECGLVMSLELHLQKALELVRIEAAADHQPQAVRDELHEMLIGRDLGVVLEQGAAVFGFEVGLDRHESVLPDL